MGVLEDIRKQHPDTYRSKLLHGRWTIGEYPYSRGLYCVHDGGKNEDLVSDKNGSTIHFNSIVSAEKHVEKLSGKKSKQKPKKTTVGNNKTYKSAATMFRDLILNSELDDDSIFLAVQQAFNLDDSRRSYVGWYRKDLQKKGQLT